MLIRICRYIAVGAELYKKIEVVGKGGGGKVYKVSLKDDDTSVWAIKKIKLDDDDADLRTAVVYIARLESC